MRFDFNKLNDGKLYAAMLPVIKTVLGICFDIDCVGKENIPENGGFIVASNHISLLDPAIIMVQCPRVCHYMAKSELFKNPILAAVLKGMNAFPVKRGTSDVNALSYARKLIEQGRVLGIFPEGTRSKDRTVKKAKSGVAFLARKTGADVLPVSLYRSQGDRKLRPKISVRFGNVIDNASFGFDEEYKPKQIREVAAQIMDSITELWNKGHIEVT